jgi:hypothetical protein
MMNTAQQARFDPIAYKKVTRQQWDSAAAVWHRCGTWLSNGGERT